MTPAPELVARLRRMGIGGLIAALAGGALCAYGYLNIPERFFAAYLTAFIYWLGLAMGCLAMAMIHGMTGGAWGRTIRRVLEAGYQTLPVFVVLFVPIWLAVARIYPWADPHAIEEHAALARKARYLNVEGFHIRAVVYFAIWIAFSWGLNLFSPNDEPRRESTRSLRLQRLSGAGFIAYGFTYTLAAVDWIMSLEPEWYSTMYGLTQIAGQGVAGLSLALCVIAGLGGHEPWSRLVTPMRLGDLGSLLLAGVMFWAYVSFFQYLVIWSGNLPEENVWYVHRSQGGWQYLAMTLMGLHFAVPFLLLLSRRLKRQASGISRIAAMLLVMRYVDLYWQVIPGFERGRSGPQGLTFHWLDLAAMAAIGGLWLAVFAWRLAVRAALPMYDPDLKEVVDARPRDAAIA